MPRFENGTALPDEDGFYRDPEGRELRHVDDEDGEDYDESEDDEDA